MKYLVVAALPPFWLAAAARANHDLQGRGRGEEARRCRAQELHDQVRERREGRVHHASAKEKKLAGAAEKSFTTKCVGDKVGK